MTSKTTTWPVEFYVNGELQATAKLTKEQAYNITNNIEALDATNATLTEDRVREYINSKPGNVYMGWDPFGDIDPCMAYAWSLYYGVVWQWMIVLEDGEVTHTRMEPMTREGIVEHRIKEAVDKATAK